MIGAGIVNYNAGKHLKECVDSLREEGVAEIVVVDNGSVDDSLALLADAYPDVPVFSLPDNPGYGTAMNRAVKELTAQDVLCLNPDTVLTPGSLAAWQRALNDRPDVAIVGPRLEDSTGTVYPSGRRFPSLTDGIGHAALGILAPSNVWTRRYKMLDRDPSHSASVDWVSGSAMLIRRAALDSVGGWDEKYFMYLEEVDLCRRLRLRGWGIVFDPAATVVHHQGVSTDRTPYRMIVAHHRSLLRYYRKFATGPRRLALPLVAVGLVVRLPVALAHRWVQGRGSHGAEAHAPRIASGG